MKEHENKQADARPEESGRAGRRVVWVPAVPSYQALASAGGRRARACPSGGSTPGNRNATSRHGSQEQEMCRERKEAIKREERSSAVKEKRAIKREERAIKREESD